MYFLCKIQNIVLLISLITSVIIEDGYHAVSVIAVDDDTGIWLNDPDSLPLKPEDEVNWLNHPCRRDCSDAEGNPVESMTCYYSFRVESYRTMSKACYNCPGNVTDCFRMHCIPADGLARSVQVVNRQLPGPSIQVCEGDRIVVDVTNSLLAETTTVHWHGQHNRATPYMDGVPYVTQCPILPGAMFRYDYTARTVGTHFWHSHSGFQRGDGVFGALIVKNPSEKNPHFDNYDIDEHVIIVTDWDHEIGSEKFLAHHHANGGNKARNILVNGLGRYHSVQDQVGKDMPIATFPVDKGLRYRFRLINAGFLNCPIEISIDNHTMTVISTDGNDIKPLRVKYLVSYAGERFDFVVNMNQEVKNYWIRFRGLMDCDERFFSAYQVALLTYNGSPIDSEPNVTVSYDRPVLDADGFNETALIINALNEGTESKNNSISMPLLESIEPDDDWNTGEPDYKFYISYDFYDKDNPHFHRKDRYGFHQVKNTNMRLFTPQLNHISMKLPSFPLLTQRELIGDDQFCNSSTVEGCKDAFCACTHVLQVKMNSIIEIILVDEGVTYDANHPFHLHGHDFRVVAMAKVDKNITVEKVKEMDESGLIQRKLVNAPIKDTVTVPDGGYTIIRFHANNPGYWLFHCHIEFHVEVGMALILKVGDHSEFLPVPRGFPRCGDWKPPVSIMGIHEEENKTVPKNNASEEAQSNDVNQPIWYGNTIFSNNTSTYPSGIITIRVKSSADLFQIHGVLFLFEISFLIALMSSHV